MVIVVDRSPQTPFCRDLVICRSLRALVTIVALLSALLSGDRDRQREKIDEAFGVLRVVAAHGEAGQIGAIERERRLRLVTLSVPFQSSDRPSR